MSATLLHPGVTSLPSVQGPVFGSGSVPELSPIFLTWHLSKPSGIVRNFLCMCVLASQVDCNLLHEQDHCLSFFYKLSQYQTPCLTCRRHSTIRRFFINHRWQVFSIFFFALLPARLSDVRVAPQAEGTH